MKSCLPVFSRALLAAVVSAFHAAGAEPALERLKYHNPGLVVDLGVGLWAFPLPQDLNGDGRLDLAVSCPDKPFNGTYFLRPPRERRPPGRCRYSRPGGE